MLEFTLENQVFPRIPIIIDMNLVNRIGIHFEIFRTAEWILQRLVVHNQSDITGAAMLIAVKGIDIGVVDLGLAGN